MERVLDVERVEGEIAIVIDYKPGHVLAVDVLQGAMRLIESLDRLDDVLLSSVDSSLEPVSVLNDVQHSSLKMILQRALRSVPDDHLGSLEWKKWVGGLLVRGKYKLLQHLDGDAPEIQSILIELQPEYAKAPGGLIGYTPPNVYDVREALDVVATARASLPGQAVIVQTELGDVSLPEQVPIQVAEVLTGPAEITRTNTGVEFFKVKSVDMLGQSQWTVLRNNRLVKVDFLHQRWLREYHERRHVLLPGDSLECKYEEVISYDANHTELERRLAIVEVLRVITPPVQPQLGLAD